MKKEKKKKESEFVITLCRAILPNTLRTNTHDGRECDSLCPWRACRRPPAAATAPPPSGPPMLPASAPSRHSAHQKADTEHFIGARAGVGYSLIKAFSLLVHMCSKPPFSHFRFCPCVFFCILRLLWSISGLFSAFHPPISLFPAWNGTSPFFSTFLFIPSHC